MPSKRSELNAARSASTQKRLLREARTLFETIGYENATVADIVGAADVSRGTFYVHFGSKREIFVRLTEEVYAQLLTAQLRAPTDVDSIEEAIEFAIRSYLRMYKRQAKMLSQIEQVSFADDGVRRAWRSTRDRLISNTEHALEAMRVRGIASFRGPSRNLAMALGCMVERMGFMRYVAGYRYNDEEFFAAITEAYINGAGIPQSRR